MSITDLLGQTVGGGIRSLEDLAPRRPQVTAADLDALLAMDPTSAYDRGRIRGAIERLGLDRYDHLRQLVEWLTTSDLRPSPPAPYENPCRVRVERVAGRRLEPSELAWIEALQGADDVTDDDVRQLAELEAELDSNADRRLVERVLSPHRRRHDLAEEQARHEATVAEAKQERWWHRPDIAQRWEPIVADVLAREARERVAPQLERAPDDVRQTTLESVERDARATAGERIRAVWASQAQQAIDAEATAQRRLQELQSGADPITSAPLPLASDAFERGAARGRREAEQAHAAADSLTAGMTVLGGDR